MNINKCICTGRLTKDPELRSVSDDMKVCQLRLAVDEMGRGREVGYINVSVFGKAGEAAAEYLAKGWLVAVDGRLEYGEWEAEGGEKRHDTTSSAMSSSCPSLARPRSRCHRSRGATAARLWLPDGAAFGPHPLVGCGPSRSWAMEASFPSAIPHSV